MRVVIAGLAVVLSGCFAAALPPSQTEIGPALVARGGDLQGGLKLATGAHLASAELEDPTYDFGAGYVFESYAHEPSADDRKHGRTASVDMAHGGYLDVARRIARGHHSRTWLGLRGESLWSGGDEVPDLGLMVRLGWELFSVGSGAEVTSEGVAAASGTVAIGGYFATGYRASPAGGGELIATAGLSIRLPFIFGMGWR